MTTNTSPQIEYHPPTIRSWRDEEYFTIHGVVYQEKSITCTLFQELTPPMNLEQLSEHYKIQKRKGNPVPANSLLISSIWNRAYDLRTEDPEMSEQLRAFFQQSCRRIINAFTCVDYNPLGKKDRIIHNPGTSEDEFAVDGKFVGPDDWFSKLFDRGIFIPLLGTSDVDQINKRFKWINNTDGYFWRENSKPQERTERRAVRFNAGDYGLNLDCLRFPRYEFPAFRVITPVKSK